MKIVEARCHAWGGEFVSKAGGPLETLRIEGHYVETHFFACADGHMTLLPKVLWPNVPDAEG